MSTKMFCNSSWYCRTIFALVCLLTLFLTGCGGGGGGGGNGNNNNTPTGPAPSDASGLWTGTWTGTGVAAGNQGLTVVEVHQNGSTITGYATIPYLNLSNVAITGTVNGYAISFGDINNTVKYDGTFTGLTSASGTYHSTRWGGTDGTWSVTQMMTPFDDTSPSNPVQGVWSNVLTSTMGNGKFRNPIHIEQTGNDFVGPQFSDINRGNTINGRIAGSKVWFVEDAGLGGTRSAVFAGTMDSANALSGNYVFYDFSATPNVTDRGTWDTSLSIMLAGSIPFNMVTNVAKLNGPAGVALDASGNLFVADSGDNTIRQLSPAGQVTTLAGTAGEYGNVDATGADARFYLPIDVAADTSGNVFVVDSNHETIRKIVVSSGEVTTLPSIEYFHPYGVAADTSGNIYLVSQITYAIRKITPLGVVTTLPGTDQVSGNALAVGSSGNIYVADTLNNIIVQITPSGDATTLAGTAGQSGSDDGTGAAARFNGPVGIAVDTSENVYVADHNYIRKITPAGVVSTILDVGTPTSGVAVDDSGNLFFTVDGAILKFKTN